MVRVILNSPGYTYDVHSLVKAFFSETDVKIITEGMEGSDEEPLIVVTVSSGDVDKTQIVSGDIKLEYDYQNLHLYEEDEYEEADRAKVKNVLKLALYRLLSKATGKELLWGTLTGIRPTKIPMKMIAEGCSDEAIKDYLRKVYYCSDEKIKLATQIAHLEKNITDCVTTDGYSLYIGIPFCPTTCLYCSFTSYPITMWKKRVNEYLDALKKEIDYVAKLKENVGPDSVYIGGGTPTTLEADELRDLIGYLKDKISFANVKEFTVEAGRPDSITKDKLVALKECGVTRLSINPQTMNDKTLKIIGRRHTIEQVYDAFYLAREVGFNNINMDLILGLPGEDEKDVRVTLDKIIELNPDSLTVHSMAIKRAAGMHKFLEEHEEIETVNTPAMMEMAIEAARQIDMKPYYLYRQKNMTGNLENIGFSKEGKYGIYNILIMEEVQTIIACGAGTVTKRVYGDGVSGSNGRIERCDNVKDVALYIDKIDEMIERKRNLFEQ